MSATVHRLPLPTRPEAASPARARWAPRLGAALAALAIGGAMVHSAGAEARAVRRLPLDARSALYARTVANLGSVCAGRGTPALTEFCAGQARLALELPECDAGCAAAARAVLQVPTR